MHTITAVNGASTITPLAVTNYTKTLESRSVFHDTLDGGTGFVYVPPRAGSGTLTLVFLTRADATTALELHALSDRFIWTSDDAPEVGMTYALDGGASAAPDGTGAYWSISVNYRVVNA